MITNDHENSVEKLIHRVEDYCTTSFELFKLKAVKKLAEGISMVAAQVVTLVLGSLAVFVLSIGLALWVGELLGKLYYGFFAVGGFYAVVGILFYNFGSSWIKVPLSNTLNEHILKD